MLGAITLLLLFALLALLLSSWADHAFTQKARTDAIYLFAAGLAKDLERRVVREEDLAALPGCVRRHLQLAGVVGSRRVRTARLRQRGRLRTKAGARWLPISAEQYFATDEPGFVWVCRVAGVVRGLDRWVAGEGRLMISLLSALKLADLRGSAELDQGEMLRYLSELVWLPSAWLDPGIRFEPMDERSARIVMRYREQEVQGTLHFDQDGLLRRFDADRYREHQGSFTLTPFFVELDDYRDAGTFRIPYRGRASWQLDAGAFCYAELEIASIDFDSLAPYAR